MKIIDVVARRYEEEDNNPKLAALRAANLIADLEGEGYVIVPSDPTKSPAFLFLMMKWTGLQIPTGVLAHGTRLRGLGNATAP
jgi:hypothetical protein